MTIHITDECVACGACEDECPNAAAGRSTRTWRSGGGKGNRQADEMSAQGRSMLLQAAVDPLGRFPVDLRRGQRLASRSIQQFMISASS